MRTHRSKSEHLIQSLSFRRKWDLLAEDYYSPFHLTTRNFDAVVDAHLSDYLCHINASGPILEVGGGRGRLHKLVSYRDCLGVVGDISLAMMRGGRLSNGGGAQYLQMTAFACPFRDSSFTAVVSLLGDSFATKRAFEEFLRILRPLGTFLMCSPSLTWGKALRESLGIDLDEAVIPTRRHGSIRVPSYLYGEDELAQVLQEVGFGIEQVVSYSAKGIITRRSEFSEHVLIASSALEIFPEELPLVTFALARRPQE